MDLTSSIAAKSDQMDYQDFLPGPRTVTVTEVRKGPSVEQPVEVLADGLDRPWRPAKSMRRVLVAAWGADSSVYVGRRMTLFGDPTVKWAGAEVGGIRLSHLSHIDKPLTVALTVTRGKRAPFKVDPLPDAPATTPAPPEPTEAEVNASTDLNELRDMYTRSGDEMRALILARKAEIEAGS